MTLERSAERDAAITAMLPYVEDLGWSFAALKLAAGPDADLLFTGPLDMVEAHSDLADRWMEADAAAENLEGLRLSERVRAVVALRLARSEPTKDAVRRGLGVLGLPGHGATAARCLWRTADTMWHVAGDTSADLSWYTKRATLAAVYSATVLFWLRDASLGSEDTLAFLDRRLGAVARFGRMRRRAAGLLRRA